MPPRLPAHHSPIPVPLHWQDDIKAGMNRDVRLGVLEPVPIGEPVTWCHGFWVWVCHLRQTEWQARKNNRHPTPEPPCHERNTSHQSPFHQARSVPQGKKKTVFDAWNAYHSTLMTDTTPHLSPLGAATDIARLLKATSPRTMDTPEDMRKSPRLSQTKPNSWTIPYYGLT